MNLEKLIVTLLNYINGDLVVKLLIFKKNQCNKGIDEKSIPFLKQINLLFDIDKLISYNALQGAYF